MEIILLLLALIISVVLHELMHGVVGDKLGDPTPRMLGRITLNPIKHIDPVGSILVPGLLAVMAYVSTGFGLIFGWAKPVPINPIHFQEPRKDMALVALAGPLTNLLLALISAFIFNLIIQFPESGPMQLFQNNSGILSIIGAFLYIMVYLNLILMFLNLLPIPPLDGSKIVEAFLTEELALSYSRIAPYGIFLLLLLLFVFNLGVFLQQLVRFFISLLGLPLIF